MKRTCSPPSYTIEVNKLLHPHQGAFRCGKSTEDILLVAVDSIVNSLDSGQSICAAFLDLRKAYDSLDHCILLQKLKELNVTSTVLKWFQNYLSRRIHHVKRSDQFSNWQPILGGIPQGSSLGPLLFLIYMNKLSLQVTDGLLVQYPDDTTLICCGPLTLQQQLLKMNSLLQLVSNFISDSRMMLNFNKSNIMWFRGNRKKLADYPPIVVDRVILKLVDKQKYLWMIFDPIYPFLG